MKPFTKVFGSMRSRRPLDTESPTRRQIYREWDRQRSLAMSPSDRAEIDAIFSRHL
ncbi:MAG: hypothetical protein PSX37_13100 [bacterium]|nr:hypothetical protein [bacterium]